MKSEGFLQYLFPLLMLLFYFVINRGKKKEPEPQHAREESEDEGIVSLPRAYTPPPSAPAAPTTPTLTSQIEKRKPASSLEQPSYLTSITDARAQLFASSEFSQGKELTAAEGSKGSACPSRGKKILRQLPSVRNAFVIREIFRRLDEDS